MNGFNTQAYITGNLQIFCFLPSKILLNFSFFTAFVIIMQRKMRNDVSEEQDG